ncbi:response regulator transcription factor [Parachitinimonas caeni]|uniref:Response regulator transcription factor n=1 Tax=Parachitinimonas caeni TaxID=3031301 RepID=A0ABT7E0W2_9NEIS|nr:response regulator transcription factor [Parachitinimonas caeni]MDK2125961.1 response regulator transcription factor [Parachitinimonas caeni]
MELDQDSNSAKPLILADDDETFIDVLARALSRRGYTVHKALDAQQATTAALQTKFEFAVVDLKLGNDSGLKLIESLLTTNEEMKIVMLTGYASITTAVESIKLGACHYLAKPAGVAEIITAFEQIGGDSSVDIPEKPLSVDRLEWEHIQKVLAENEGNISATARALNMHRRTLQRKLGKRPSPNQDID